MYLLRCILSDTDVHLSLGDHDHYKDGQCEDFLLSPNRWKKLAAAYGIAETEEPIPITEDFYDAVCAAAEATKAVRMGAKILSGGPKSRRELVDRLASQGIGRRAAGEAADFLAKRGYLDETKQATALALSQLRRNRYGKMRIRAYLASHGYPSDAVNAALASISPVEWREALDALIERRFTPWAEDYDGQQKAYAALARLGYTAEEVKTVLKIRHER